MAENMGRIVEGVFAIHKPPHVSSAQVIRDLQSHFLSSKLFQPTFAHQLRNAESQDGGGKRQRRKRQTEASKAKIGHGGTLDPLATGVLVLGLGRGTKQLHHFLGCTKTYETVILFGKGTDTYDVAGKVVASSRHEHITKALVEQKLAKFRGHIRQVPPIFSALKIDGIKAYDYARSGRELPRALEAREMEVQECELLEWFDGGKHDYRWPAAEASREGKEAAQKLMAVPPGDGQSVETSLKRKLSELVPEGGGEKAEADAKQYKSSKQAGPTDQLIDADGPHSKLSNTMSDVDKAELHTHEPAALSEEICPAPAARIRLTTSSGFYVRSFAHDLGIACDSLALMSSLFRSRQGSFDAADALTYDDLGKGEDTWGPKLQKAVDHWNEQHTGDGTKGDANSSSRDGPPVGREQVGAVGRKRNARGRESGRDRRNSSSED